MFLAWRVYAFWCAKSSRRNWVMAVCADRLYVRLYMTRETARAPNDVDEPDVVVFEASEIDSMSVRTVKMFLYGPKPKFAECLVIQPSRAVAESVPAHSASFLEDCGTLGCFGALSSSNLVCVTNEDGRLIIGWKSCHPALRVFVRQVIRECPSLFFGPKNIPGWI
jgi:hypothetical protein